MTQISVLADLKSKPRGIIKQKTSKSIHLWFLKKSVLESNCKCFRKKVIWENSNLKPEIQIKKAPSKNRGNYPVNRIKNKREAVTVFFHFCLNKIWAAGQTHVCNSKSSLFFQSSQTRNTFQVPAAPPSSKCINRLH